MRYRGTGFARPQVSPPAKGGATLYDSLAAGQGVEPLAFVASIWGESLPHDVRWTGRDAGYRVAATDLRTDNVADTLAAHGERLACFTMDVSDIVQVHAACDQIEAHFGRIDVCVNNAGFLQYANCEQTTPELWHKTLRVNLDGVFYVSQRVAPGMKVRGFGRIVNMASFGAKTGGLSPLPAYAASKGGVISLTFSFAREYAPFGVTCNALAPTFVKTQMLTEQVSPERQAELRQKIPVGRFCELEELAHSVLFLAHPLSGFITGEVLDLNGGLQFD